MNPQYLMKYKSSIQIFYMSGHEGILIPQEQLFHKNTLYESA